MFFYTWLWNNPAKTPHFNCVQYQCQNWCLQISYFTILRNPDDKKKHLCFWEKSASLCLFGSKPRLDTSFPHVPHTNTTFLSKATSQAHVGVGTIQFEMRRKVWDLEFLRSSNSLMSWIQLILLVEEIHRNPAPLGCKKIVNDGRNYLSTGSGFLPSRVWLQTLWWPLLVWIGWFSFPSGRFHVVTKRRTFIRVPWVWAK